MRHWVSHLPSRPPSTTDYHGSTWTGPLCPVCGTPEHADSVLPESHELPGLRVYVSRPMSYDAR